jgi:hypothetical protein
VADLQIGDFVSSFWRGMENVGAPTMRVIRDSRPATREMQAKPKIEKAEKWNSRYGNVGAPTFIG